MASTSEQYETYNQVKGRLDEIADKVAEEDIGLDDALDLYEEAVKLAYRATELIEIDELDEDANVPDEDDDVSSLDDSTPEEAPVEASGVVQAIG